MKQILFFVFFPLLLFSQAPPSYSVIIVGGGASGLSCATSCVKMGFSTLVIDTPQSAVDPGLDVTNWPGHEPAPWDKTINALRKEFEKQGGTLAQTAVTKLNLVRNKFQVTTDNGSFQAVAVVIATGKQPPEFPLAIPTKKPIRILQRLWDCSIFSRDDAVIVIGNSQLGLKAAIQISFRVNKVMLLMRPPWQATGSALERTIQKLDTISWLKAGRLTSFIPQEKSVLLTFSHNRSTLVQKASWIVIAEEWVAETKPFHSLVQVDSTGAIVTQGETGITKTPGLFACGEVASNREMLAVEAATSGIRTSWPVALYLVEQGVIPIPPEKTEPPPKEKKAELPSEPPVSQSAPQK